jgi:DNA sulfur modification protein DndC
MEVKTTKATQLTFEQAESELPSEKTEKISSNSHTTRPKSAFEKLGFKDSIKIIHKEIQGLYLADNSPWIIGYSGGKDSTGTLQLIWNAVAELPKEKRQKTIHVISTDTMVENPIVAGWVKNSLESIGKEANKQELPFSPKLIFPRIEESFWVNLIGRGYPAPRNKFRWCTDRLKINPSNRFISEVVNNTGEAILCLGARVAESSARAKVIKKHSRFRFRDRLSPSSSLPGCMIYTPVEEFSNDDIWFYLNNTKNPWGINNKELMGMYAGASKDGECPLVVDTNTQSCGNSRFGCWVCTMVEQDKSMAAMIQNDSEKEWMLPLLELRNELDFRNNTNPEQKLDHHLRDFRRMGGAVQLIKEGQYVPGPYTQQSRANWLRMLLEAQVHVRRNGPPAVRELDLISLDELKEIRRIWVVDKHELEDILPKIYEQATGGVYPEKTLDDNLILKEKEMQKLEAICGEDRMHYELIRELLSRTRQQRSSGKRANIIEQLEKSFQRHFFENKEDAIMRATKRTEKRNSLKKRKEEQGMEMKEVNSLLSGDLL